MALFNRVFSGVITNSTVARVSQGPFAAGGIWLCFFFFRGLLESLAETVGEVASFSALCVSAPDMVVGGRRSFWSSEVCFFSFSF